ncbi:hypothetical protein C8J56DRAFT_826243 [Mycena floridula]|nr:hypothetical protein C8J56DRAFT_826243 [Mycena floridula]
MRISLSLPLIFAVTGFATQLFDGQYIETSPGTRAVEWWWGSIIGKTALPGKAPPTFQFLFYEGYPVVFGPRDPSQPQYYIDIKGFTEDGTSFDLVIPAVNGSVNSTHKGQGVVGVWNPIASFQLSSDLSTMTVKFTAEQLTGTLLLKSNAAHHFGCNVTDTPYFDGLFSSGKELSESETTLFKDLGWATTIPGGIGEVDVVINGSRLRYTGSAYHDANWAHSTLNDFIDYWYFGYAEIGPYSFSFVRAGPLQSTLALNTGYLNKKGVVLQNQCSVDGSKTSDVSIIAPYGTVVEEDTGSTVPSAFNISFVLADATKITFNFDIIDENPRISVYHRFMAKITGGIEGDAADQVEGYGVVEWLNPSIRPVYPS